MKNISILAALLSLLTLSALGQVKITKKEITVNDSLKLANAAALQFGDSIATGMHSGVIASTDYVDNAINLNINDTALTMLDPISGAIFSVDISSYSANSLINLNDPKLNSEIQLDGKFARFNHSEGTWEFATNYPDIIWQGAFEDLAPVYNNTLDTIYNGMPVWYTGNIGDSIATIGIATNRIDSIVDRFFGLATHQINPNSAGVINVRGYTRELDNSGYSNDILYLGDSILIDTVPAYPNKIVVAGGIISNSATEGIVYTYIDRSFGWHIITKDYSFTSQGIASGTWYVGGFYNFASTDANLTQAVPSQTYGTANSAHSSHAAIVCGGAGTATGGVVGLRVTGASITDDGILTLSDADTLLTDITAVSVNEYYESIKFVGILTYELITISGTPTSYAFDFNYGNAKYDDIGDRDYYVEGIECVGLASATDADFNIELLQHHTTGWTYAATGFAPGDGNIVSMYDDLNPYDNVVNGSEFTYKRTGLSTFIKGSESEGVLFRITTTQNNTVQFMNVHLTVAYN